MELSKLSKMEDAKSRLVSVFQVVHGLSETEALQLFEVEAFTFEKQIRDNASLSECTKNSMIMTFLAVLSSGLSFNSSQKLVYLMTRSVEVVKGKWEKQLVYQPSPDGKIYQCQRAGTVKDVSRPVIVYEGDRIEVTTNKIDHSPKIPRGDKIIGGYCTLYYNDGRSEAIWVDIKDMDSNKKASEKKNKGKTNPLYTSNDNQIDIGFFSSKIINTALKNKAKKATYSEMEVADSEDETAVYVDTNGEVLTIAEESTPLTNDLTF